MAKLRAIGQSPIEPDRRPAEGRSAAAGVLLALLGAAVILAGVLTARYLPGAAHTTTEYEVNRAITVGQFDQAVPDAGEPRPTPGAEGAPADGRPDPKQRKPEKFCPT